MQRQRNNSSSAMEKHSNFAPPKKTKKNPKNKHDNSPETKLQVMEYCDPTDRGLKTAVTERSNELQASSERQFNKLRNKIKGQMEYCTKEIETLKKNKNYGAEESNKQDRKCKWKALEIEETTGKREWVSLEMEI